LVARLAVVVLAVVAVGACKGDAKKPPHETKTPVAIADAGVIQSQLKLVGCSAAQAAPTPPSAFGAIGASRHPRGNEGYGITSGGVGRVGTGPQTPQVTLGALTVKGPFPKATVAQMLAKHHNRLQFCYEQRLVKTPSIAGSSTLAITILPNGHVFEASVDQSIDDELSLCLKHVISESSFGALPTPTEQRTAVTQKLTFAWSPGTASPPRPEPKAWTPFAAGPTAPPSVADPAAALFPPSLTLAKLEACLGTHTGSFRSLVTIATDGSVIAARTGGLGDKDAETCVSTTLVGTKTQPVAVVSEVACDFQRGDATPWRLSLDAGYTVIEAGKPFTPDDKDAEKTFVVVADPKTTSTDLAAALTASQRGAASLVALRADAGAPIFVAAGPQPLSTSDPSSPLTLDTRDPLTICGGLLDEPKSAAFNDADKLLAAASRRCTHRPCPSMLVISTGGTHTGLELAALAGAARGVDFERIVIAPSLGCARK
jgi:hypothetical protein